MLERRMFTDEEDMPWHHPLPLFLMQLVIVVTLSRILTHLCRFVKQPSVVAEIISGIILGPSICGHIPKFHETIFPATSMDTFVVIADIGLILFMFMVGLEVDVKLVKKNAKGAVIVSVLGMLTPFAIGMGTSYILLHTVADDDVRFSSFILFSAVALSITAFPVLSRILGETKIMHTRVGSIALAAAAVDDVVAWCMLAVVISVARATSPLSALWTFLLLLGFVAIMLVLVKPLLASITKHQKLDSNSLSLPFVTAFMVSIFVCAWITEAIGVHAIFGSFVLGMTVPRRNGLPVALVSRIEDLVVALLLPLYFTFSGIRTDIGVLSDVTSWLLVGLVTVTACLGKMMGGAIAARILNWSWRESISIGILLNTKGLVELIVLNIGLDVGVLNTKVFSIFVLMALITTFITTPAIHFVYVRHLGDQEAEPGQDTYNFIMPITSTKNYHAPISMLKSCMLFSTHKKGLCVKVLRLTEISDRPSSYFFSEYSTKLQETLIRRNKVRNNLLDDMKEFADTNNIDLKIKPVASADIPYELHTYATNHPVDMVIIELPFHTEGPKSWANLQMMFHPTITMISSLLDHATTAVGVMVHKDETYPEIFEKVLFVYTGNEDGNNAWNHVLRFPANVEVYVITDDVDALPNKDARPVKIVVSENPLEDYPEQATLTGVDLVIRGTSRTNVDIFQEKGLHERCMACSMPVMIIFPPRVTDLPMVENK